MAVGQPETNLNTWGLRYVKKKKGDAMDLTGDAPTKSPQFGGGSELDTATANPSGRQNDSSGDTTGRYSSGGKKVGEQVHEHKQEKDSEFGQKKPTYTTGGSPRGEGATHGADTSPTGQGQAGQALTAGTKKKPVTTSAGLGGAGQTHTGSEGFDWARNPQTSRGGHSIKPAKQGEGSSKTPKGTMIQRASLDLAIIKCKLLKMNNIQKDFIEDSKPTRPQFRKDDEEDYGDVKEEAKKDSGDIGHGVPKPDDGTPQGKAESDKEIKDKKLDHVYRSEDIVDKAIELINEAYDEMKSTDFRKLKPIYEGDTKQAKKDAQTGEGSNKPSKRGDFKTDNRDLENSRNETSTSNLSEPASTMDQTPRDYEVTSSGKETGKKRVTNRPTNTFSPSPHQKEPQTSVEQADETAWDDANRKWNKQVDSTNWGKDSAGSLAPEKSPERQGKGALKTDGGTSTTSSEGSANFVYSDVKEAEKQKQ